jgi:branched-chain amino acid transport system permease protein
LKPFFAMRPSPLTATLGRTITDRRAPRKLGSAALGAGVVVLLAALPLVVDDIYYQHVLIICLVYVVLGQAWNLVGGYAGQWSLGHAAFFGLGAYTSTLLLLHANVSPWLGMVAGGTSAAAVACVIAFPCFRLRTHYFAMATLAIGETLRVLFLAFDWTGGATGLVLPVQRIPSSSDMLWASKLPYFYVILALAVATTLLIAQVERSRLGVYLRAINQDEDAAARLGIEPRRYKLLALAGSAFVTGVTGTFYAQYTTYIDPFSVMPSMLSVRMVLVPVFGGLGTVAGPVIGAFTLIPLSEITRVTWGGRGIGIDQVVYGAIIVWLTIWMPGGVMALVRRAGRGWFRQARQRGREASAP